MKLDHQQLCVAVDLDLIPPHVAQEFMAALDHMHRVSGGSGLEMTRVDDHRLENGSVVTLFTFTGDRAALDAVKKETDAIIAKLDPR